MRYILFLCSISLLFAFSGCRCCGVSSHYNDTIDDVGDYKANWEDGYCPKLDISRAGMCDWCSGSLNRSVCPCRCNRSACCRSNVYYPSEHTLAYQASLAAKQSEENSRATDERAVPAPSMAAPKIGNPAIPVPPPLGR